MMKKLLLLMVLAVSSLGLTQEENSKGVPPPPPVVKQKPKSSKIKVFHAVEKAPEYKGGYSKMVKFITKHIKYPQADIEKGNEGRVYVRIRINTKGEVKDAEVIKGQTDSMNAEALRVIRKMPKWIPGEQRGKKVNCYYTVPISFKIG